MENIGWCLLANNSVANTSPGTDFTARDLSRAGFCGEHLPEPSWRTRKHVPGHQSSSDAEAVADECGSAVLLVPCLGCSGKGLVWNRLPNGRHIRVIAKEGLGGGRN